MQLPNINVKKILYATDLSESARYAFVYAASLSSLYKAGITILHVIEDRPSMDTRVMAHISSTKWEEIKQQHEDEARAVLIGKSNDREIIASVLEQFSRDVKGDGTDHRFTTDAVVVKRGNPVEQILRQADEHGCELIVMGTHGIGTLADAMLGSTAQRVIRRSKIPVLVIRLPDDPY